MCDERAIDRMSREIERGGSGSLRLTGLRLFAHRHVWLAAGWREGAGGSSFTRRALRRHAAGSLRGGP
jgi:hypothetical protein